METPKTEQSSYPQPKKSLYHIMQDHFYLISIIENNDGVISDELNEALKMVDDDFKQKAISYGYVIKKFQNDLIIIENEIKRLQKIKNSTEKNLGIFVERLDEGMRHMGWEKVDSPLIKIGYRNSSSIELQENFAYNILKYTSISVKINPVLEDEAAEQEFTEDILNFFEVKIIPCISKISNAIKSGKTIPGADLVLKKHLSIR